MVLPLGFGPQHHVFLHIHSIDGDSEAFFEGLWSMWHYEYGITILYYDSDLILPDYLLIKC